MFLSSENVIQYCSTLVCVYRIRCDTFCLGVVLGLQTPGRVGSGGTVSEYLLVLVVGVGPCGAVSYPGRCVENPQ